MLTAEYKNQLAWRDWDRALALLPLRAGETVFDLGCGVGDQAALLAARGARVLAIDADPEMVSFTRSRRIPGVEVQRADLTLPLPDFGILADGLWCSFAPAYFPDLTGVVSRWLPSLRQGAWMAFIEVDDLFGHLPLRAETRAFFQQYEASLLAAGRYDFYMGRKLKGHLEACGLDVTEELSLPDQELSFAGPATPAVKKAWWQRLDRLAMLRKMCGPQFDEVRDEFLACLSDPDHRSTATVRCCLATYPRS